MTPHLLRTHSPLNVQLITLTLNRMMINTGFRMIYPLLPVLARSVGVEIGAIASVLALTNLLGLSAPVIGTATHARPRRFTILLGMSLYIVGLVAVFLMPNFWGLALAMLITALGKIAFDPAVQAFIGERVPYERRGRVMALMELSWSGAFILGVPLMTWLLGRFGWQAPFGVLMVMMMCGWVAILVLIPSEQVTSSGGKPSLMGNMRVAIASRAAILGLVHGFGISAANQLVSVVFGAWIELSFGVALAALAAASIVIGSSELLGEGVVARFADTFGKKRLVMVGVIANIVACVMLPFTSVSLTVALIGLFVFYLGFEVALVATLPLATELSPSSRAVYMTLLVAAFTLGRAILTPFATPLFDAFGIWAVCGLAAVFNIIALAALSGIRTH